jgi:histidine triad (HIT) family protein
MKNCNFCLEDNTLKGKILAETEYFYFVESIDPILCHAGMIIPKRHIETPFEFNDTEWIELKNMLEHAKEVFAKHNPDGFNIGWNVGEKAGQNMPHVHLHVIARFGDEPLAYKGIRYAFKQENNRRP